MWFVWEYRFTRAEALPKLSMFVTFVTNVLQYSTTWTCRAASLFPTAHFYFFSYVGTLTPTSRFNQKKASPKTLQIKETFLYRPSLAVRVCVWYNIDSESESLFYHTHTKIIPLLTRLCTGCLANIDDTGEWRTSSMPSSVAWGSKEGNGDGKREKEFWEMGRYLGSWCY